jgi:hypothetical protein
VAQWVKGQSGNPAGRKPLSPELAPAIRRELRRRDPLRGVVNKTAIAQVLVAKAVGGDLDAIRMVLDRVDGRVPSAVEWSGSGQIRIEVVYVDEAIGPRLRALAPPA